MNQYGNGDENLARRILGVLLILFGILLIGAVIYIPVKRYHPEWLTWNPEDIQPKPSPIPSPVVIVAKPEPTPEATPEPTPEPSPLIVVIEEKRTGWENVAAAKERLDKAEVELNNQNLQGCREHLKAAAAYAEKAEGKVFAPITEHTLKLEKLITAAESMVMSESADKVRVAISEAIKQANVVIDELPHKSE